jgi:hypothetical protein
MPLATIVSLRHFAELMHANTASAMVVNAGGHWPPPPTVSLAEIIETATTPLAPVDLRVSWEDAGGNTHSQTVPPVGFHDGTVPRQPVTFSWTDPGAGSPRAATQWQFDLRSVDRTPSDTPENVSPDPRVTVPLQQFATDYNVTISGANDFVPTGPSDKWSFRTDPAPAPPKPPSPLPPTTPPPVIQSVAKQAAGVFAVKGTKFLPSHTVTIRVVNTTPVAGNVFQSDFFQATSDGSGNLDAKVSIPGIPSGLALAFSANDGRQVPPSVDATGTLWSNTVSITS